VDGRRFDEVARALGAGASRRRVLAGLAGGALAVLFGGRTRAQESAAACAAVLCETNTKCCDVCGQGTCVPIDEPCPLAFCAGEPCGGAVCGEGEFCCNESCGICAPIGGACTLQACDDPPGEPCNAVTCGAGEFCCNFSCSICAPVGGFCTAEFCGDTGGFGIGQRVVTTDALNYRTAPGLGAGIITVLPAGTAGGVLDGPVAADGYTWYQLGLPGYGPDGATPGWVAGEFLAAI